MNSTTEPAKLLNFAKWAFLACSALLWVGCTITDSDENGNAFFDRGTAAAATPETAPAPTAAATQPSTSTTDTSSSTPAASTSTSSETTSARSEPEPTPAPAPAASTSSNTSGISAGGNAIGGGFVFKPISEGDGNLVILTPSSVNATSMRIEGSFGAENGRFVGRTNGNRATFRFSRPGCGYGNNIRVTTNGGAAYNIPAGCNRVDL